MLDLTRQATPELRALWCHWTPTGGDLADSGSTQTGEPFSILAGEGDSFVEGRPNLLPPCSFADGKLDWPAEGCKPQDQELRAMRRQQML